MTIFTYLISFTLLAVSIAVLAFIFRPLLSISISGLTNRNLKNQLNSKMELLKSADQHILSGDLTTAVKFLKDSFFLQWGSWDVEFVDAINTHHMSILSRMVSISDRVSSRLEDLPLIEGLFISRHELLRAYIEVSKQQKDLSSKIKSKGKDKNYSWAKNEFTKKKTEIHDKLATNSKTINSKLEDIFNQLTAVRTGSEITYH